MEPLKHFSMKYGEIELEYIGALPLILTDKQFEKFALYDKLHPTKSLLLPILSIKNIDDCLHVWGYVTSTSYRKDTNKWKNKVSKFFME